MNNNNIKEITNVSDSKVTKTQPLIFTKKVNDNHKIISLHQNLNTLGASRHFPSSTKEWLNSIYTYNNNSSKSLSIADKNLTSLVKSYFDMYYGKKVIKYKRISTRYRRLSPTKIFVGKPELKHTNSKVTITLYVYNEQRRFLNKQIKELKKINFSVIPTLTPYNRRTKGKALSILQRLPHINYINQQTNGLSELENRYRIFNHSLAIANRRLDTINKQRKGVLRKTLLLIDGLEDILTEIEKIIDICVKDDKVYENCTKIWHDTVKSHLIGKDITTISKLYMQLNLNKSKFENKSLFKLKTLVKQMYAKEVEFNVINLKYIYLDSNIFTEAIAKKLKDRDNRLLKVLRTSLNMVKLPKINRTREKYGKPVTNEAWMNKISNRFVSLNMQNVNNNNILNKNIVNQDILNKMLLDVMPNFTNSNTTNIVPLTIAESEKSNTSVDENTSPSKVTTVQDIVLNALKDKSMSGVRFEAKGRLTRRYTAARAVFKIRWKGGLQTIISSYKKVPSVMLRGHVRPNVQYTLAKNKNRIGAYGIKGWVSSR